MTGHEARLVLNIDIGPEASYRSGAEEIACSDPQRLGY